MSWTNTSRICIDEKATFAKFGYFSTKYTDGSTKHVVSTCGKCGQSRVTEIRGSDKMCIICSQRSDEKKKKISKTLFENPPMLGKKHSKESKKKMSDSTKGQIVSDKTRKKISLSTRGEKNHFYGKHHTKESKQKMSENNSMLGLVGELNPQWKGGKKVYDIKTRHRRTEYFSKNPIILNKPFDNSDGHHLDSTHIINIPRSLHASVRHSQVSGKGMKEINMMAIHYMYENSYNENNVGVWI